MKTTVVYHRADFDGLFCREIARKFLGDEGVEYIGWDFGDPPCDIPADNKIYVLDLPLDKPFGSSFKDGWLVRNSDGEQLQPLGRIQWDNWVWIDHHKSSIESHPASIPGYRIDGVAACRLAWQWFSANDFQRKHKYQKLPDKRDFIERIVIEPLAVRLAGEYDVWDHAPSNNADIALQFGLRCQETLDWKQLLSPEPPMGMSYTWKLIGDGHLAMRYQQNMDERMMHSAFLLEWEGLKFLACNGGGRNSDAFASKDVPETGHDALMLFYYNGKGQWVVSLYHAAHRKDLDLSQIAVKHGGGGHRGACGMQFSKLPFLP